MALKISLENLNINKIACMGLWHLCNEFILDCVSGCFCPPFHTVFIVLALELLVIIRFKFESMFSCLIKPTFGLRSHGWSRFNTKNRRVYHCRLIPKLKMKMKSPKSILLKITILSSKSECN